LSIVDKEHMKTSLSSDAAIQQAEEKNCTILYADDRTLQIDIDTDEDYEFFEKQVSRLREYMDLPATYDVLRSISGNRHILIQLPRPLPVKDRIMLQACLGSDRVREILSYARYRKGDPQPVLLFRPRLLLTAGEAVSAQG
jgi:hypothetical protein